uniref:SecY-independent transporter protein n=1 Tax=Coleochaete scutata TaxID=3125 RepID=A0A6G9IG29_COLSC|nr:SecY-independent transporter protein [Coleochaete scutata]
MRTYDFPLNWQLIVKECKIRLGWSLFSLSVTWLSCYCFSSELVYLFTKPFVSLCFQHSYHLIFLCSQITEAFHTTMAITLITCMYSCMPLILYQIWCFCIPACFLYQRIRSNACLFESLIWFVLTMYLTFTYLLPHIGSFLYGFHQTSTVLLQLHLQPKISDSITLIIQILLGVTFCSQIPLVAKQLLSSKIISVSTCIKFRRFFLLFSVLMAALLSPPDLSCQLITTIATLTCLELAIVYAIFCYVYQSKLTLFAPPNGSDILNKSSRKNISSLLANTLSFLAKLNTIVLKKK